MAKSKELSRRYFLHQMGLVTGITLLSQPLFTNCNFEVNDQAATLSIGIVADAHADLIPDKNQRLEKFIAQAIANNTDFIIQLGDFCFPKKENLDFIKIWNQFKGPKYHLLGNHDMDLSTKEETMAFWEMPSPYYSFDQKGIHFVVLDPNYLFVDNQFKGYANSNFYVNDQLRTYINTEQIEWLKNDLQKTQLPTILFSHQSLINPNWGIKNRIQIQNILETENRRAGYTKIFACFNGHDHIDFHRQLNGIHYIEINSLSYQWLGEKYSNKTRYPSALYDKYVHLDKLAPYKDPLFAFAEIKLGFNDMTIDGIKSNWISPSPNDLQYPKQVYGAQLSPNISDRKIKIRS